MKLEELEKLIMETCDEYVRRWKTEGSKDISVQSFEQLYAEGNVTPIEPEYTLTARLGKLSSENSDIPPGIPLLPLPILRRLSPMLTKTAEIQINWDHYEYWAWSAEVFRFFEGYTPLLKELKDRDAIELLYLLFHICLARLGQSQGTREAAILNSVIDAVVDRHVKQLVFNKFVIGIPVGAAVLEAVVKTFIELYEVDKAKKRLHDLEAKGRDTLGKILMIFDEEVLPYVSQELRTDLEELNEVVESVWSTYGENWRKILLFWRNRFMHGAKTWAPRAFAVYTNYICLIVWHTIPQLDYESGVVKVLEDVGWRIRTGTATYHSWSFYPP